MYYKNIENIKSGASREAELESSFINSVDGYHVRSVFASTLFNIILFERVFSHSNIHIDNIVERGKNPRFFLSFSFYYDRNFFHGGCTKLTRPFPFKVSLKPLQGFG